MHDSVVRRRRHTTTGAMHLWRKAKLEVTALPASALIIPEIQKRVRTGLRVSREQRHHSHGQIPIYWSLRNNVIVNHCGIHSAISSGFATRLASCVLHVAIILK